MASVYVVRHAQASFGAQDYDRLSVLGLRQAKLAGRYLQRATRNVRRVISGSLVRHRATAAEIIRCVGSEGAAPVTVNTDARLNELDIDAQFAHLLPGMADPDGELADLAANRQVSGRSYQFLVRQVFPHWQTLKEPPGEVESWMAFSNRVGAVLDEIKRDSEAGESTIVVTSGAVIAVIIQQLLELPANATYPIFEVMMNCSVTRLLHDRKRFSLSSFNDCSYLWVDEEGNADPKLLTYR